MSRLAFTLVFSLFSLGVEAKPALIGPRTVDETPSVASRLFNSLFDAIGIIRTAVPAKDRVGLERAIAILEPGLRGALELPASEDRQRLVVMFHETLGEAHGYLAGVIQNDRNRSRIGAPELAVIDAQLEAAKEQYRALEPLLPEVKFAQYINRLGVLESRQGNETSAQSFYSRALAIYHRHPHDQGALAGVTLHNYASLETELGRPTKAIRLLEQSRESWRHWADDFDVAQRAQRELAHAHRALGGKRAELDFYQSLRWSDSSTFSRPDLIAEILLRADAGWTNDEKLELLGLLADGAASTLSSPGEDEYRRSRELREKLARLQADPFFSEALLELKKLVEGHDTRPDQYAWWRSVDSKLTGSVELWRRPSRSFQNAIRATAEGIYGRALGVGGTPVEAAARHELAYARRREMLSLAFKLYSTNLDPRLVLPWLYDGTSRTPEQKLAHLVDFRVRVEPLIDWDSNSENWGRLQTFTALSMVRQISEDAPDERLRYEAHRRHYRWYLDHIWDLPLHNWDEVTLRNGYFWADGRRLGRLVRIFENPVEAIRLELNVAEILLDNDQHQGAKYFVLGSEADALRFSGPDFKFPSFPPLSVSEVAQYLGERGIEQLNDLNGRIAGLDPNVRSRTPQRYIAHRLEIPVTRFPGLKANLLKSPNRNLSLDVDDISQVRSALTRLFTQHQDLADLLRTRENAGRHELQRILPLPAENPRVLGLGYRGGERESRGTIWFEKQGITHKLLFEVKGPESFYTEWDRANIQLIRL